MEALFYYLRSFYQSRFDNYPIELARSNLDYRDTTELF